MNLITLMCKHICSCISIYFVSIGQMAKVGLLLEIPGAKGGLPQ
jgi:hypothetical protein